MPISDLQVKLYVFLKDRLYSENHGPHYLPCKPASNFHGQKPDIRICENASDFISTSVLTVEEYLQISRGLEYLPVIILNAEDMKLKVISEMRRKELHIDDSESLYSKLNSEYQSNDLLPSRLFSSYEIEGMEFAITVVLCFDDGSDPYMAQQFYLSITRTSAKLVTVVQTVSEKLYRKKMRIECFENALRNTFTNTNGVAVLVGFNNSFNFLTEMSKSKLKSKNIDLPKVKAVTYFKGTNEVIILQITTSTQEMIYKNLLRWE